MSNSSCRECGAPVIFRRWITKNGKKIFPKHAKAFCFSACECKNRPIMDDSAQMSFNLEV
jgi:hypothetical protein